MREGWLDRVTERVEAWTLAAFVAIVGAAWGFIELAEVIEGEPHAFDEALLLAFRNSVDLSDPIGPGWIEELAREFTAGAASASSPPDPRHCRVPLAAEFWFAGAPWSRASGVSRRCIWLGRFPLGTAAGQKPVTVIKNH